MIHFDVRQDNRRANIMVANMLLVINVQKCLDCTMLLVPFYRKIPTKALKASTLKQSKQTASKLDSQEANS